MIPAGWEDLFEETFDVVRTNDFGHQTVEVFLKTGKCVLSEYGDLTNDEIAARLDWPNQDPSNVQ